MTVMQIKITCLKCGIEKLRKHFQRDSKEYKSCNECRYNGEKLINDGFKKSFELFDNFFNLKVKDEDR